MGLENKIINFTKNNFKFIYDSHPIPSLSTSNLCGSGGRTVKFLVGISLQSKSGGLGGIQKSGYAGSQLT